MSAKTLDPVTMPSLGQRSRGFQRMRGLIRFFREPATLVSSVVLGLVLVAAVVGPHWTPHSPNSVSSFLGAQGPTFRHPLGNDILGRDVLSRMMVGARPTIQVGILAISLAAIVGTTIGLVAGYIGRSIDAVSMRVIDAIYAFPALILVLGLIAVLGRGITAIGIAIAVVNVPVFARVMRSQVLSVKNRDYVSAAASVGASPLRILVFHVAPNSWAPVLVQATILVGYAILIEASLSFLGLSVPPPAPTWGGMLEEGFRYIRQHPMLSVTPGLGIFVVVLACNLLGDALRDALDPKIRRS